MLSNPSAMMFELDRSFSVLVGFRFCVMASVFMSGLSCLSFFAAISAFG